MGHRWGVFIEDRRKRSAVWMLILVKDSR